MGGDLYPPNYLRKRAYDKRQDIQAEWFEIICIVHPNNW